MYCTLFCSIDIHLWHLAPDLFRLTPKSLLYENHQPYRRHSSSCGTLCRDTLGQSDQLLYMVYVVAVYRLCHLHRRLPLQSLLSQHQPPPHPQLALPAYVYTLSQHPLMDGYQFGACCRCYFGRSASPTQLCRYGYGRSVACREQGSPHFRCLSVPHHCLHLPLGTHLLRLRVARQRCFRWLWQCYLVGLYECYHGGCGDFPCYCCRQVALCAPTRSRYDVLPRVHHLRNRYI